MPKILVNDGIHPDGKMLLEDAGFEVDDLKIPQDALSGKLPEYDVIIVRSATKVRQDLIEKCPNLKVIARGGVGLDNIDVEYAESNGIKVINTPAASSQSVAELVFTHLFNLARFVHDSNRLMPSVGSTEFKQLKKKYSNGVELRGKTLGLMGFGRIGQNVARAALGFGMNIMPVDLIYDKMRIDVDIYKIKEAALSITIKTDSFENMLKNSDFITVHVPFQEGNRPLIGKKEIGMMKDGVFIINAARGGVIDEAALLEALNSGKVGGAGLDVFENEPTPNIELLKHPKVSLSPHIGASTIEAQRNIGLELADAIIAVFDK